MSNRSGKESLYIVIPAYNEAANICRVVEDWYPVVEEHDGDGRSRLVIIDDGSTDDTYSLLAELSHGRPLLEVLAKENSGHGPTLLFGYRYALANGADLIFQTDSDGQTDPADFAVFWETLENHTPGETRRNGAVIGNRVDRQDGRERKLVAGTVTRILRAMFGVRVPDANTPFRLMGADLVARYLPLMPEDYSLPNIMLTTFFSFYGEKIVFLPVTFRARQGGVNSISRKKIVKIGWKAIRDFREIRKGMPPR